MCVYNYILCCNVNVILLAKERIKGKGVRIE